MKILTKNLETALEKGEWRVRYNEEHNFEIVCNDDVQKIIRLGL